MIRVIQRFIANKFIKKIDRDKFIDRLRVSVIGEGMLPEGNIYLIDYAINKMPLKGNVIEIGCYGGLSTNLIIHLMKKHGRAESLLTCDPWIYEGFDDHKGIVSEMIDGRSDVKRADYTAYIKDSFVNGLKLLSADRIPFSFQLSSDEFFQRYDANSKANDLFERPKQLGGPISFAYIDGNHALDYVKRDFRNVDKHLLKGGYILFDDSMSYSNFGSAIFMKEMMANPSYKFVAKNPNFLFRKV